VRHGADAAPAPPRRLLVGRDADRRADDLPGDVGRVAVAGLHAVVVVRAGMKMIGLPFAASSTRTTFVVISVRRASAPR
jgi:hypothetical protein